jgi:hypothetical protein
LPLCRGEPFAFPQRSPTRAHARPCRPSFEETQSAYALHGLIKKIGRTYKYYVAARGLRDPPRELAMGCETARGFVRDCTVSRKNPLSRRKVNSHWMVQRLPMREAMPCARDPSRIGRWGSGRACVHLVAR